MIRSVYRDPSFEKSMNTLRAKGGTALLAAKKAEEILSKILIKGRENSHRVARLTRKGELRIKCGIKYDLGNGYRLVCAKRGSCLCLLYVGSHDDCDRWLHRNKGSQHETGDPLNAELTKDVSADFETDVTVDPADEYEEQLMKKIDDKVLKTIFCGLVEKQF